MTGYEGKLWIFLQTLSPKVKTLTLLGQNATSLCLAVKLSYPNENLKVELGSLHEMQKEPSLTNDDLVAGFQKPKEYFKHSLLIEAL